MMATDLIDDDINSPQRCPTESLAERINNLKYLWQPTVVQSFASFGMGMLLSMFGSTLIHMSLLFDVSIATMSLALTVEYIGYLVGSVSCAFVASRLDYDCVTASTVLVGGLATICAPLIFGYYGFVTSWAIRGVATGLFNPHVVIYCVTTWKNHPYRNSAIQFQYGLAAVGATSATFIINSFLINIKPPHNTVDNSTIYHIGNEITPPTTVRQPYVGTDDSDGLYRVIYAYFVVGLVTVACSVPAMIRFVCRGAPCPCLVVEPRCCSAVAATTYGGSRRDSYTPITGFTDQPHQGRPRSTAVRRRSAAAFLYGLILFFIGFFCGPCEVIIWSYLMTFAVKQLLWSSNDAALLMSILGIAHCVGRVLGVPLALLPAGRVLIGQALLTTIGLVMLFIAGSYSSTPAVVVWIGDVAIGVGLSTFLGLMFLILFDDRYSNLVGAATMSATVSVGVCVGSVTASMLVGHLLEIWTSMCVVYFTGCFLGCLMVVLGIRLAVVDKLQRLASSSTDRDAENKEEPTTNERTPCIVRERQ